MKPLSIDVIHGPNLNLLGVREPELYGTMTLDALNAMLEARARQHGVELRCHQRNGEGELVDVIHGCLHQGSSGIIINPGAYTHSSIAVRDALAGVAVPTVEVHLSNVYAREAFRHRSMIADIVVGRIMGFREHSYLLGLDALVRYLRD